MCVITPTRCNCSPTTPSGTCTRPQGDGTCLLGPCQSGFRCDCLGFETCAVSKCGKYVPVGNEEPSLTVPFQCAIMDNANDCITMTDVLDTVEAARNAASHLSVINDMVTTTSIEVINMLRTLLGQKQVVGQMLRDVDRFSDDIPKPELDEINSDTAKVSEALTDIVTVVRDVVEVSGKARDALEEARELKRTAVLKGENTKSKRKDLRDAEEKAKSENKKCESCEKLTAQIEKPIAERKNAARDCARKAQEARKLSKAAADKKKEAETIRDRAADAFRSCGEKVRSTLGKVSGRVLPGVA